MTEPKTRSLLVKMGDGTQKKIHGIPTNAKVTFGKVNPAASGERYGGNDPYCLRIYTSQNNQLAVFVGVREFRDLSLTVESRSAVVKTKKKTETNGDNQVLVSAAASETELYWESEE